MATIDIKKQQMLNELIAEGHRKYGKVAPRHPYKEDDKGGAGSATFGIEEHPLFMEQPIGVPDLSHIMNNNAIDEAERRSGDLSPELRNNLDLFHKPAAQHANRTTPKPSPI